jgi:hypothetical protein
MHNSVVILLLGVIVVGGGLVVVMSMLRRSGRGLNQDEFRSKWLQINGIFTRDNPSSWQVALMEADKLLDAALIAAGATGSTLGERLKNNGGKLSKLNAVWGAHKLRNQVAHEPNFHLNYASTEHALAVFKTALKDLGAI